MRRIFFAAVWLSLCVAACGQTIKPLVQLEAPSRVGYAMVCEGGENLIGFVENHDAYVWSLPSGARRKINVTGKDVTAVACNPNVFAMGLSSGEVLIFDPAGTEKRRFGINANPQDVVETLAISPGGDRLAAATDHGPVQLWDVASGKHLWTGSTDFGNTWAIKIAPDGNRVIASDTDARIRAYDRQGKLEYSVESSLLESFGLSLSLDGKRFIVGGADGTMNLHDSTTGAKLKQSENSGNVIWRLVMAPDAPTALAVEIDDGYRMAWLAIGYWNTAGTGLKTLAVDPKTVLGIGRDSQHLLLVRQDAPGTISVDSVE